jgi:hypothetical protein
MNDATNALEIAIVCLLIDELREGGYVPVAVWDGDGYNYSPKTSAGAKRNKHGCMPVEMSVAEVLDVVFGVDNSTIHFAPAACLDDWGDFGVAIVGGNGVDCIVDHHVHRGCPWERILNNLGDALISGRYTLTMKLAPKEGE